MSRALEAAGLWTLPASLTLGLWCTIGDGGALRALWRPIKRKLLSLGQGNGNYFWPVVETWHLDLLQRLEQYTRLVFLSRVNPIGSVDELLGGHAQVIYLRPC